MGVFIAVLQFTEKEKARFKTRIAKNVVQSPCIYPDMDDCWIWQRFLHRKGYGQTSIRNATGLVHRASYAAHVGDIPDDMCVCHKCDTPGCCNPNHLFLGTKTENIRDRDRKGRCASGDRHGARVNPSIIRKGESHVRAKLKESDVIEIREKLKSGIKRSSLAKMFGVSDAAIYLIEKRVNWRCVP